jgi:hypothetical protein
MYLSVEECPVMYLSVEECPAIDMFKEAML